MRISRTSGSLLSALLLLVIGACGSAGERSPAVSPPSTAAVTQAAAPTSLISGDPSVIRSDNLPSLVPAARLSPGGGVVWSSDGRMFAVGGERGVAVFSYQRGAVERLYNLPTDSDPGGLAFSPDGRILATGGWDGIVRLWDAASGELIHSLVGHTPMISSLSFRPDGRILASASYADEAIFLWDPDSGERIGVLPIHGDPGAIEFSPDGRWIGVASAGLWPVIEFLTVDGTALSPVDFDEGYSLPFSLAFSPTGGIVAAAGDHRIGANGDIGFIRLYRVLETGLEPELAYQTEGTGVSSIAYSPDGEILAIAGRDNRLELRSASDGRLLYWLDTLAHGRQDVSFSPDSRILALGRFEAADTILWEIGGQYDPSPRVLSWQTPNLVGSDVWQVELRLVELGYLEAGLDDGIFDDGLEGPVRSFQAANHLPEDGVVGPETRERLFDPQAVAVVPLVPSMTPAHARTATPIPTVTRTPAATATPSLFLSVHAARPSGQDILEIPSIWEYFGLAEGLDLPAPGRRLFSVDVDPEMRFTWSFYWCASDEEILADNLSRMTVGFEIDRVALPPEQILEYEESSQGWSCHHWATLLSDWQPGAETRLDIRYVFSQDVNDGSRDYPAGDYWFVLKATVGEGR